MASGQQLADEYVLRFAAWKQSKSDGDFRSMVVRGALSRKDIVAECGFSGSVLNQNPRVKEALKRLEDDLRERGVLPPLASSVDDKPLKPSTPSPSSHRAARDAERLNRLEQENASLKAENGELKRLLGRYAVLQEVLAETGRVPR
ncbi:VPA1267 family protein [Paracidovorax konjaci]|uniref:Uncharacterized protein n=1 Tax=Paracidovorax konjaci TaxID=32040 RepID=A0A1I1XP79_9BURK|nr:VPA1267 family protein [Paracidovorax konjaci]SFE07350.1 hypothetical protein SAMN04489710_11399 [Paracidovorax konjaci]